MLSVFVSLFAATDMSALLGQTLSDITKHRGKPKSQPEKNKAVWAFEGDDGLLLYGVRFGADGRSIAESLQPGQNGRRLHTEFVVDFIKAQRAVLGESTTVREVKPGERYTFAGQQLSVAENEYVILDEPRGFLLVWVRGSLPSVTVVTPEALQ